MVVGFDFGTHQTKICIEDRSDPQRPMYKFWKFVTQDGESYTLPSVVQINKDDTLLYGYVDKSCVKEISIDTGPEPPMPKLNKPIMSFSELKPKLKLPEKPKAEKTDWKDVLKALNNGGKDPKEQEWEKACKEARLDYDQDYRIWKSKYERVQKQYEREITAYNQAMQKYEDEHKEWVSKKVQQVPAIFRYFKQATFSNAVRWKYSVSQDLLSIWYIAYILFDLETEYGQTFSIQFGFPTDAKRLFTRRNHAYRLILSAYHLVEDVFQGDKETFLLSTYQELTELTKIVSPSEEKVTEYGILALPEAYANLVTVTAKKQIEKGISFVVDIGGTTNISLFNIDENNSPHIYGYTSIDKGINYIMESSASNIDIWKQNSLYDIPASERAAAVSSIIKEVQDSCKIIVREIFKAFDKVDLSKLAIYEALEDRIVVYSGGGSTYDFLCQKVHQFTDVRRMDKKIWNGFYLEDVDDVLSLTPILSTALGLSVQRGEGGDGISISDIHDIFSHLPKKGESQKIIWGRREEDMYGLADD